ncbi:hypothetical protein [Photobacterium sp. R1]
MTIQATKVTRKKGFWTHPGLLVAQRGETISDGEFEQFEAANKFKVLIVDMEGDANPEFVERWFDEDLDDCSPWEPTAPSQNAFLLSIHDTEDGPVAWFAEPFSNSEDVQANLSGVKQTVNVDTSDIGNLSGEQVKAIAGNVSHKIQLKQDDEA